MVVSRAIVSDLVDWGSGSRVWDKIIAPGATEGACYAYPKLKGEYYAAGKYADLIQEALVWRVTITGVTFAD